MSPVRSTCASRLLPDYCVTRVRRTWRCAPRRAMRSGASSTPCLADLMEWVGNSDATCMSRKSTTYWLECPGWFTYPTSCWRRWARQGRSERTAVSDWKRINWSVCVSMSRALRAMSLHQAHHDHAAIDDVQQLYAVPAGAVPARSGRTRRQLSESLSAGFRMGAEWAATWRTTATRLRASRRSAALSLRSWARCRRWSARAGGILALACALGRLDAPPGLDV